MVCWTTNIKHSSTVLYVSFNYNFTSSQQLQILRFCVSVESCGCLCFSHFHSCSVRFSAKKNTFVVFWELFPPNFHCAIYLFIFYFCFTSVVCFFFNFIVHFCVFMCFCSIFVFFWPFLMLQSFWPLRATILCFAHCRLAQKNTPNMHMYNLICCLSITPCSLFVCACVLAVRCRSVSLRSSTANRVHSSGWTWQHNTCSRSSP